MIKRYQQSGQEGVTNAVDKLQQEVGVPLQLPTFPSMVLCAGRLEGSATYSL